LSIPAIRSALANVLGRYRAQPLMTNVANDLYEAYLFSTVIDAGRRENAVIEYYDGAGNVASQLLFRRSPGVLHGNTAFTHGVLRFPNREPLEVHVGVRVSGVSHIAHECDIAVLRQAECDRSRHNRLLPRPRGIVLALEAKYYSVPLSLGLGRALLGLDKELYGAPTGIVTNFRSDDILAMILHHAAYANHEVLPGTHEHDSLVHFVAGIFHRYRYKR
jgi:hypothetical protein